MLGQHQHHCCCAAHIVATTLREARGRPGLPAESPCTGASTGSWCLQQFSWSWQFLWLWKINHLSLPIIITALPFIFTFLFEVGTQLTVDKITKIISCACASSTEYVGRFIKSGLFNNKQLLLSLSGLKFYYQQCRQPAHWSPTYSFMECCVFIYTPRPYGTECSKMDATAFMYKITSCSPRAGGARILPRTANVVP